MDWSFDKQNARVVSPQEEVMIEFIVARKHHVPMTRDIAAMNDVEKAPYITDEALDQRDSYFDPYRTLTPDALKISFEQEQQKLNEEVQAFCLPLTQLDAQDWEKRDAWSLEEALSLWLGFKPRPGFVGWVSQNRNLHSVAERAYALLDDIGRALAVHTLSDPVRPTIFVSWANEIKMFDDVLFRFEINKNNLLAKIKEEQQMRLDLQIERDRLKKLSASAEQPSYYRLLQMFAAVCIAHFKANPLKKHDFATKVIAGAVEHWTDIFENSKPDTSRRAVRRLLNDAKVLLPEKSLIRLVRLANEPEDTSPHHEPT